MADPSGELLGRRQPNGWLGVWFCRLQCPQTRQAQAAAVLRGQPLPQRVADLQVEAVAAWVGGAAVEGLGAARAGFVVGG
jgi:hypothetical protein